MSESLRLSLVAVLFGMAIAWLVLVKLLFLRLERFHPERYDAMGRPSLVFRNTPFGAFQTLKFVILRQHRILNDTYLSRLSDGMLCFFLIYLFLFIGLIFLLPVRP